MEVLLLKLVLTPMLIGAASLASRRWGAEVGGWLVGIPFTSGPIALFLSLEAGPRFAAAASVGILAATTSQAAFALAYAWVGTRAGWPASFIAATSAFFAVTVALNVFRFDTALAFFAALGSLVLAIGLMPRRRRVGPTLGDLPWWDLPARMVVATLFVVALTSAAPALGAHLAGLLSPFPLYATVLAVFAHRLQGPDAALAVVRGLLLGLFAFVGFFVSVALLLVPGGVVIAFVAGIIVALVVQGLSLVTGRMLKLA